MKKSQIARYANYCNNRGKSFPAGIDRDFEVSAIIYMYQWSKSAKEIVGAAKLLRIADIMRAKSIIFPDGQSALYPEDLDEIRNVILERPEKMEFEENKDG